MYKASVALRKVEPLKDPVAFTLNIFIFFLKIRELFHSHKNDSVPIVAIQLKNFEYHSVTGMVFRVDSIVRSLI